MTHVESHSIYRRSKNLDNVHGLSYDTFSKFNYVIETVDYFGVDALFYPQGNGGKRIGFLFDGLGEETITVLLARSKIVDEE